MDYALNVLLEDQVASAPKKPNDIILTNHFGDLSVHTDTILTFEKGVIGFSAFKSFALVKLPQSDDKTVFRLLVSIDEPHLAFIVFPTTHKTPLIDVEDVASLCKRYAIEEQDLLLLHIASIQEDAKFGHKITLNLKAPIVINAQTRQAEQFIFTDKDYTLNYKMDGKTRTA